MTEVLDRGEQPSQVAFEYSSLLSASSIRLIRILSAELDGRLVCRLEEVDLNKSADYVALSYCWGSYPRMEQCLVNDNIFEITTSLAAALRQIRADGRPDELYIWADALCINQADIDEKAIQIKLMPQIYAKASKVIAWVSRGKNEEKALHNIQRFVNSDCELPTDTDAAYTVYLALMRAFVSVSQMDYWRRIWIIQEVCLAQRIELASLSARVLWKPFFEALGRLIGEPSSPHWAIQSKLHEYIGTHTMHLKELDTLRGRISRHEAMPLLQALYWTRKCDASIVKDKIFALMGLVTDNWSGRKTFYYGDDLEKIEQEITFIEMMVTSMIAPDRAALDSTYRLDVLTFVSFAGYAGNAGSPRWCPSWTDKGLWPRLRRWQLLRVDWASLRIDAAPCLPALPSRSETGALILHGRSLGAVVTRDFDVKSFPYQKANILYAAAKSVLDELNSHDRKATIDWQTTLTVHTVQPMEPWKAELERYRRRLGQMVEHLANIVAAGDEAFLGPENLASTETEESQLFADCQDQIRGFLLLGSSLDDASSIWNFRRMHFFRTSQGFIGFGLFHGTPGDLVFLVDGFSTPVILRRYGSNLSARGFVLVGELFALGVMKGEYYAAEGNRGLLRPELECAHTEEIHLF